MDGPPKKWLLIVALTVGYVPNLIHLYYPLCGDHAIFQWISLRALGGEWPYVEQVDHTFPGGFLLHLGVAAVFGDAPIVLRSFDWIWQLATGLLLFHVAGRLAGRWAGFGAMMLHGVLYGPLGTVEAGNRESLFPLLYLVCIVLLARVTEPAGTESDNSDRAPAPGPRPADAREPAVPNRWRVWHVVAVGSLSGMMVLIKPTHGLWCLALAFWLTANAWRAGHSAGTALKQVAIFAAASILPCLLAVIPFALAGHLNELIDCTIRANLAYAQATNPIELHHFLPGPRPIAVAFGALVAVGLVRSLQTHRKPLTAHRTTELSELAFLWALAAAAGIIVQRKFFPHHMVPWTAATCLWGAVGVAIVAAGLIKRPTQKRIIEHSAAHVPDAAPRPCQGNKKGQTFLLIAVSLLSCGGLVTGMWDPVYQETYTPFAIAALLAGVLLLSIVALHLSGVPAAVACAACYGLLCDSKGILFVRDPYVFAPLVWLTCVLTLRGFAGGRGRRIVVGVLATAAAAVAARLIPGLFTNWQPAPSAGILASMMPGKFEPWPTLFLLLGIWGFVRAFSVCARGALALMVTLPGMMFLGLLIGAGPPGRAVMPFALGGPIWVAIGAVDAAQRIGDLLGKLSDRRRQVAAIGVAAAGMLAIRVAAAPNPGAWTAAVRYQAGQMQRYEFLAYFLPESGMYRDAEKVAAYLREHSDQDETILVFPGDLEVAYLSGRATPTRFCLPRLLFPVARSLDEASRELYAKWQAEFLRNVLGNPPRFVIFRKGAQMGGWIHDSTGLHESLKRVFPEITEMLEADYQLVRQIEIYSLYERQFRDATD